MGSGWIQSWHVATHPSASIEGRTRATDWSHSSTASGLDSTGAASAAASSGWPAACSL